MLSMTPERCFGEQEIIDVVGRAKDFVWELEEGFEMKCDECGKNVLCLPDGLGAQGGCREEGSENNNG